MHPSIVKAGIDFIHQTSRVSAVGQWLDRRKVRTRNESAMHNGFRLNPKVLISPMCACMGVWVSSQHVDFFALESIVAVDPLKVFLVEDSAVIRASLIATLEELAPVQIVDTAEEESHAIEWMRNPSHVFDLAIVDIQLHRGSGLSVISAVKSLSGIHKSVVLTNYATPDMRRKCLSLGANRVFDKSNEIDALLAYCRALAAGEPSGHGEILPA